MLTKVQYDMLADDAKSKITQQISDAGVGSPFVFDPNQAGTQETLTGYKVTDPVTHTTTTETVRKAEITADKFIITLATFTPALAAVATPGASLNWDVPATGFTVSVDNPTDYTSKYIDSVVGIAALNGSSVSAVLADYSAGAKSATPAGGVDWTQAFTTGGSSYIRSSSTDSAGGSASGRLSFNYNDGTSKAYADGHADFSVSWATPSHSISLSALTGKTFLKTYTSADYTPSVTGITNASNRTFTISGTNGTPSSTNSAGTLTFATALHKTNASSTTTKVSLSTVLHRPSGVTGSAYDTTLTSVDSVSINTTASFSYPSFWLWTSGVATVPSRSDCVTDGTATGFDANTTVLGDQVKTFAGTVTNSEASPRAFWFAVRASASQPTSFKTAVSSTGLLSDVDHVTETVSLQPDTPPAGYTSESYKLYGIIVQPGSIYISIS